ncbi:MAG: hypothetical protein AAB368_01965, partial [bacterium]
NPLDNVSIGAGAANYAAARETFERLKSIGFNMVYTHNYGCEPGTHLGFEEALRAADDAGVLVGFSQPHFEAYDWDAADAERTNGYVGHAAHYVRAAGSHPSVVFYVTSHNGAGYEEDINPDLMGTGNPPRNQWSARGAAKALRAEAIIRSLDPARIVYHHSAGDLGAMDTVNFYANFAPAQEMADWLEPWAGKGIKPLFLVEFGVPLSWDWTMYRGWYKGEREFGSGVVPWENCLAEWNAQFLGDRAFGIPEEEKRNLRWEARQFREGNLWHRWDYPVQVGQDRNEGRQEIMARYFTAELRAFRAWGLSGVCVWDDSNYWTLRPEADRNRKEIAVDWDRLQRPGFSPDYLGERFDSF